MRRLEKNFNLFDAAPNLVKEWHPTANGNLTPRNVKIVNPKMVWWICNQGHEWKATIKFRIQGSGCPLCRKEIKKNIPHDDKTISWKKFAHSYNKKSTRKPSIIFELDSVTPDLGSDFRKTNRFKATATATVEISSTRHWLYAEMKNFSSGGMYLEANASLRPGTNIKINLDRPLFFSDQQRYNSTIRWCRKLDADDKTHPNYGIGVKFI